MSENTVKKPDFILLGVIVALLVLGILILASVSAPISQEKFESPYYFLNHQIFWGLLPGIFLAFLAFKINLLRFKKWLPFLLLINLTLLAMVFLPKIGIRALGASRWIDLGIISFQPAEFLKLTFILYLASWLSVRLEKKKETGFNQTLIAFSVVLAIVGLLLILQRDASTLGIVLLTGTMMYFFAQTPLKHILFVVLAGTGVLAILIKFAAYRFNRLLVFLNPGIDPLGMGYQIERAKIAVGSGGIFGQGLGMSNLRFGSLPHSISDSIFAIFAEETGFIGATILIILFFLLLWLGLKIVKSTANKFFQLLALGITCWISLQAFINIGSTTGILPIAGVPLPFISYGGSALISELIGMGILLNISKRA